MQRTVLTEVYALLKTIGAVANEAEFSRDWLGRSECYMRMLRFKGLVRVQAVSQYVPASYSTMASVCLNLVHIVNLASSS